MREWLEIQELVGDIVGSEPVEYGHDAAGEVEVGGPTICDEHAGVGTLLAQSLRMQEFIVDAMVGKQRQAVLGRIAQVRCIGIPEIMSVPRGENFKAVRMQQLGHQHRDIFIEV